MIDRQITPCKRYVWDDDYITRTWYRDVAYIFGGLAVLLATGTFLALAGTPLGGVARRKPELVPVPTRPASPDALGKTAQLEMVPFPSAPSGQQLPPECGKRSELQQSA